MDNISDLDSLSEAATELSLVDIVKMANLEQSLRESRESVNHLVEKNANLDSKVAVLQEKNRTQDTLIQQKTNEIAQLRSAVEQLTASFEQFKSELRRDVAQASSSSALSVSGLRTELAQSTTQIRAGLTQLDSRSQSEVREINCLHRGLEGLVKNNAIKYNKFFSRLVNRSFVGPKNFLDFWVGMKASRDCSDFPGVIYSEKPLGHYNERCRVTKSGNEIGWGLVFSKDQAEVIEKNLKQGLVDLSPKLQFLFEYSRDSFFVKYDLRNVGGGSIWDYTLYIYLGVRINNQDFLLYSANLFHNGSNCLVVDNPSKKIINLSTITSMEDQEKLKRASFLGNYTSQNAIKHSGDYGNAFCGRFFSMQSSEFLEFNQKIDAFVSAIVAELKHEESVTNFKRL